MSVLLRNAWFSRKMQKELHKFPGGNNGGTVTGFCVIRIVQPLVASNIGLFQISVHATVLHTVLHSKCFII